MGLSLQNCSLSCCHYHCEEHTVQSINQTVYDVLFYMLARVGRLDPQQLLHLSKSNGSTLCIPYFLISHFTHCSHVFIGPAPTHAPLTCCWLCLLCVFHVCMKVACSEIPHVFSSLPKELGRLCCNSVYMLGWPT